MGELTSPKIPKWPFLIGDALLLGLAVLISRSSTGPLGAAELGLMTLCVVVGATLAVVPYVLEYRITTRISEAAALTSVVTQVQNVQALAHQISEATGRWQFVQEAADKTAATAKGMAEKMAAEAQAFSEFMQRMNESEKSTLKLEVDKLRRGEADWLQALVRVLDHVHAVYLGGLRSGQPTLIDQLTNFQNACRDAARRVGLTPFVPGPEEKFDPQRHQIIDGDEKTAAEAIISEVVATGFTFQGRLLRPALVRVRAATAVLEAKEEPSTGTEPQPQLPLGGAQVEPAR
jgi:molecular chaperone GrpE (heat shock protein)